LNRRKLQLVLAEGLSVVILSSVFRMAVLEGWDDAFYVSQTTSLFGDRDLLLHDDLWAYPLALDERLRIITYTIATGALGNAFGLGPPLLHSAYTWPLAVATPYPGAALRGLLAVGSMGLLWLLVSLQRSTLVRLGLAPLAAQLVSWVAVLASPLALYGTRAYLNSHLPSAVVAALLLRVAVAWWDHPRPRWALSAGLAAGLLVVTRWQDAVLLLGVPVLLWGRIPRNHWRLVAVAAVGAGFVVGLQPLAWQKQFGVPLLVPQGGDYVHWLGPRLGSFLFSPFHGALPWMPALGVAVVAALALLPSRHRNLVAVLLGFLVRRLGRPAWWLLGALALWGVVTASAYFAGYDDLSVLLSGAPALDNPHPAARYVNAGWYGWGALEFLDPGFSFADRPTRLDRLIGCSFVLGLVALLALAWRRLARSPALQRVALASGVVWVSVWYVLLARAPSNVPWNAAWLRVVCQTGALGPEAPPSLQAAGLVVGAARACRSGGVAEADALLTAAGSDFFPRVEARELCAFVRSPAGEARLAEMTQGPACH
jgi:hypothetical protein